MKTISAIYRPAKFISVTGLVSSNSKINQRHREYLAIFPCAQLKFSALLLIPLMYVPYQCVTI